MGKKSSDLPSFSLNILADFLNFEFAAGRPSKLKDKDAAHMLTFLHWSSDEDAKKLQAELRGELTAIVPPAKAQTPEDAYGLLEALVRKINKMGLSPEWNLEPVDYEVGGYNDPKTGKFELQLLEKSASETGEVDYKLLGYRQRVLKLFDSRWVVSTRILGGGVTSLRASLYGIVIDALESGELSSLKRCLNCQVFFVAENSKRKYCTKDCMKAADQKNAALKRVPEWRKQQKQKELQRLKRATEKQAFSQFSRFMNLVTKSKPTAREQATIVMYVKRLGKGESLKGWYKVKFWEKKLRSDKAIENIWEGIRRPDKDVFKKRH